MIGNSSRSVSTDAARKGIAVLSLSRSVVLGIVINRLAFIRNCNSMSASVRSRLRQIIPANISFAVSSRRLKSQARRANISVWCIPRCI